MTDGDAATRARVRRLVLLLLVGASPAFAVSVYKGIQPGKSTRADVTAVFGEPSSQTGRILEYAIPSAEGRLLIEYAEGEPLVDRIERVFPRPVPRSALMKALGLPDQPEEREVRKGQLIEYFGGLKVLSLVHVGEDTASRVTSLNYFSLELYDRMLGRARNLTVQYDPAACRDLYFWSQGERETARRAKDTARHQAVLEIQIVSQRGDCDKANALASAYRKRYQ